MRKRWRGKPPGGGSEGWYDINMRFRATFFTHLFVVVLLALPTVAQAAAIPFFGPIIPNEPITINNIASNQNVCAAGWGMLITVINNIIAFSITIAIVFVAPLMVAYAGFLFVVNPVNSSGIAKAKSILLNTIVGIVIALAGWMIVDAIMAVLYNANASNGRGGVLGTWSSLIGSGGLPPCIDLRGSLAPAPPVPGVAVVPPVGLESITAFGCKNASSCQTTATTNAKLNQMKASLGATASQYQITETGVNTTVAHASGTNNLDMSCYGPCSPAQVRAAISAWPGTVKYETASQSDYSAMIAAGVPAGNILGPAWFTGTFNRGVCSTGTGHCITATHMSLNP